MSMPKGDLADDNLIRQAQAGSLNGFNILVLCNQESIYSYSLQQMGEEVLAADLAQDTFI